MPIPLTPNIQIIDALNSAIKDQMAAEKNNDARYDRGDYLHYLEPETLMQLLGMRGPNIFPQNDPIGRLGSKIPDAQMEIDPPPSKYTNDYDEKLLNDIANGMGEGT